MTASTTSLKKKATTLWGRYIHARDEWCQYCGRTSGKLDAHHIVIKSYSATRTDEQNGVLCCFRCHQDVMHGDPAAAVAFYTRRLGQEGYEALRVKALDGVGGKYPASYWKAECERLQKLLEGVS